MAALRKNAILANLIILWCSCSAIIPIDPNAPRVDRVHHAHPGEYHHPPSPPHSATDSMRMTFPTGACSDITGRVVGGVSSDESSARAIVSIRKADALWCTGTIIADAIVLTAGHCLVGVLPKDLTVCVGKLVKDAECYQVTDFAAISMTLATGLGGDVAKLFVPKLQISKCFAIMQGQLKYDSGTTKCYAIGYGTVDADGTLPTELSEISVVPCSHPRDGYTCWVGEQTGTDTCGGDSGSPLLCAVNGIYYVTGVLSYGSSAKCGVTDMYYSNVHDINTFLYSTSNWIYGGKSADEFDPAKAAATFYRMGYVFWVNSPLSDYCIPLNTTSAKVAGVSCSTDKVANQQPTQDSMCVVSSTQSSTTTGAQAYQWSNGSICSDPTAGNSNTDCVMPSPCKNMSNYACYVPGGGWVSQYGALHTDNGCALTIDGSGYTLPLYTLSHAGIDCSSPKADSTVCGAPEVQLYYTGYKTDNRTGSGRFNTSSFMRGPLPLLQNAIYTEATTGTDMAASDPLPLFGLYSAMIADSANYIFTIVTFDIGNGSFYMPSFNETTRSFVTPPAYNSPFYVWDNVTKTHRFGKYTAAGMAKPRLWTPSAVGEKSTCVYADGGTAPCFLGARRSAAHFTISRLETKPISCANQIASSCQRLGYAINTKAHVYSCRVPTGKTSCLKNYYNSVALRKFSAVTSQGVTTSEYYCSLVGAYDGASRNMLRAKSDGIFEPVRLTETYVSAPVTPTMRLLTKNNVLRIVHSNPDNSSDAYVNRPGPYMRVLKEDHKNMYIALVVVSSLMVLVVFFMAYRSYAIHKDYKNYSEKVPGADDAYSRHLRDVKTTNKCLYLVFFVLSIAVLSPAILLVTDAATPGTQGCMRNMDYSYHPHVISGVYDCMLSHPELIYHMPTGKYISDNTELDIGELATRYKDCDLSKPPTVSDFTVSLGNINKTIEVAHYKDPDSDVIKCRLEGAAMSFSTIPGSTAQLSYTCQNMTRVIKIRVVGLIADYETKYMASTSPYVVSRKFRGSCNKPDLDTFVSTLFGGTYGKTGDPDQFSYRENALQGAAHCCFDVGTGLTVMGVRPLGSYDRQRHHFRVLTPRLYIALCTYITTTVSCRKIPTSGTSAGIQIELTSLEPVPSDFDVSVDSEVVSLSPCDNKVTDVSYFSYDADIKMGRPWDFKYLGLSDDLGAPTVAHLNYEPGTFFITGQSGCGALLCDVWNYGSIDECVTFKAANTIPECGFFKYEEKTPITNPYRGLIVYEATVQSQLAEGVYYPLLGLTALVTTEARANLMVVEDVSIETLAAEFNKTFRSVAIKSCSLTIGSNSNNWCQLAFIYTSDVRPASLSFSSADDALAEVYGSATITPVDTLVNVSVIPRFASPDGKYAVAINVLLTDNIVYTVRQNDIVAKGAQTYSDSNDHDYYKPSDGKDAIRKYTKDNTWIYILVGVLSGVTILILFFYCYHRHHARYIKNASYIPTGSIKMSSSCSHGTWFCGCAVIFIMAALAFFAFFLYVFLTPYVAGYSAVKTATSFLPRSLQPSQPFVQPVKTCYHANVTQGYGSIDVSEAVYNNTLTQCANIVHNEYLKGNKIAATYSTQHCAIQSQSTVPYSLQGHYFIAAMTCSSSTLVMSTLLMLMSLFFGIYQGVLSSDADPQKRKKGKGNKGGRQNRQKATLEFKDGHMVVKGEKGNNVVSTELHTLASVSVDKIRRSRDPTADFFSAVTNAVQVIASELSGSTNAAERVAGDVLSSLKIRVDKGIVRSNAESSIVASHVGDAMLEGAERLTVVHSAAQRADANAEFQPQGNVLNKVASFTVQGRYLQSANFFSFGAQRVIAGNASSSTFKPWQCVGMESLPKYASRTSPGLYLACLSGKVPALSDKKSITILGLLKSGLAPMVLAGLEMLITAQKHPSFEQMMQTVRTLKLTVADLPITTGEVARRKKLFINYDTVFPTYQLLASAIRMHATTLNLVVDFVVDNHGTTPTGKDPIPPDSMLINFSNVKLLANEFNASESDIAFFKNYCNSKTKLVKFEEDLSDLNAQLAQTAKTDAAHAKLTDDIKQLRKNIESLFI